MANNEIKIGVLATLLGPLAFMGEDALRGAQLAVAEYGSVLGNHDITLTVESTNAVPDSASEAADKLIVRRGVDFTVGPLSGNEGIALRDYARTRPERAFLNGTAANQEMTFRDLADNFFNFSPDGVQCVAGMGTYAYEMLGYRRVLTIGQAYSYPQSQVGGFSLEFRRLGGKIVNKFWVPLGTTDYRQFIQAIPPNIDAIFVALVGSDIGKFLNQYAEMDGSVPLIANTAVGDQTILGNPATVSRYLVGMVSAGPVVDDNPLPAWGRFVRAYREEFPHGLHWPSQFALGYYVNTKAALLALESIDCDLSNDQARFKEALATLEFESPTGPIRLNHNRQAILNIFLRVVAEHYDGRLYTKLIKTISNVDQTLGFSEEEYLSIDELASA